MHERVRRVLSIDDLIVDSFATSAAMIEIGDHETGCIGPCEDRPFTQGYC